MRSVGVLSLLFVGCVVPDIEIEGKPCPCGDEGYSCNAATNTCVKGAAAGTGGAGGNSTGATTGTGPCQGLCGTDGCSPCPEVAVIDAGGFLIDATEVTRGAYAVFLAEGVDVATQGAPCEWNDSFVPRVGPSEMFCTVAPYDLSNADMPMGCVDWCDARAYCKWAGKRLCGRIGDDATLNMGDVDDPAKSAWYAACSAGGTKVHPYNVPPDTAPDPEACNTGNSGGMPIGVGVRQGCEGGYPGIFDMLGNVEEWEDACDISGNPEGDNCQVRGGAFFNTPDEAKCVADPDRRPDRNWAAPDWGFRCCTDL